MKKIGNILMCVVGVLLGIGLMINGEGDGLRFIGGPIVILINGYIIYVMLKDNDNSWY
jgi:hypothetical protein